jgi:hypothetical protein
VIEIGTLATFSDRLVAVTTISPKLPVASWVAVCASCAMRRPGHAGDRNRHGQMLDAALVFPKVMPDAPDRRHQLVLLLTGCSPRGLGISTV